MRKKEKYLTCAISSINLLNHSAKNNIFNALEDINFEVFPGDSLAIIGKNGAGKSTLLKILSKITPPTKGEIILRGRLASLLEVGTGFHPELTGRENIYLNGSILGLSRSDIRYQFDAIVEFSGVMAFLDTPLKHYSSGMQLRLAFSVAAHLEPEILVIDEVLAVGDSAFQQKCINKMTEVSQSGRTLLFVSHNLQAVKNLCQSGILLESGKVKSIGKIDSILNLYNSEFSTTSRSKFDLTKLKSRRGAQNVVFSSLSLNKTSFKVGDEISIKLKLKSKNNSSKFVDLDFGLAITDKYNNYLVHLSNRFIDSKVETHSDQNEYIFSFLSCLKPDLYNIVLFIRANEVVQDWITIENALHVTDSNAYEFNNSSVISGVWQPKFEFKFFNH